MAKTAKSPRIMDSHQSIMRRPFEERKGFEPSAPLRVLRLFRPPLSTAQPPLGETFLLEEPVRRWLPVEVLSYQTRRPRAYLTSARCELQISQTSLQRNI